MQPVGNFWLQAIRQKIVSYGLSNESIPLEARILAVADAYDALTSERPYRKSFTREEALRILKENSGTQWDTKIIEAAIEVLTEKRQASPTQEKQT